MYQNPSARTAASPNRIPALLDDLKSEYEAFAHDVSLAKMQREDYERKLQSQLSELSTIQQTVYELERNHIKLKQQYEEEIMRLRRQLEGKPVEPYVRPPSPPRVDARAGGKSPAAADKGASSATSAAVSSNGPGSVFYGGNLAPLDGAKRPSSAAALTPPPSAATPATVAAPTPKRPREENGADERLARSEPAASQQRKSDESAAPGADWIVGYNPGVQTNLNVDLLHTLDHASVVCCVKFSNDGRYLATGCNRSAQLFDVETGEKIFTFAEDINKDGDLYIRSVCFSPDNRYLAAGAEDKTVKVWDIENRRLLHTFHGHELDIYSLDWSRDGAFIVSGSGDKKARIWDVEKRECLFTLGNDEVGPKDGVTSVAFSPDGRLVAAGSLDRIVRLWDAQTGYFLERYEGHLDSVYSVAFSPDGKSLASGSLDKTLKLWDLSGSRSRSRCKSTFSGHHDFVLSVAFSPQGDWLISGSKDRSVQFWDPRSAVTHMMLQGHKNSVISVAVSPVGGVFATGSGDFRARIWRYT
eukprot:TRINITY_DN7167_c0_g1_i1.p1 TRINITY_DN7167_c0_g1~~TRINITY_DN7167_c0_g1_i1.p1  ORF type:complete len:528 (+),score=145.38 TRINITY_DN7167_c0_g1_i1:136-1719(+)